MYTHTIIEIIQSYNNLDYYFFATENGKLIAHDIGNIYLVEYSDKF